MTYQEAIDLLFARTASFQHQGPTAYRPGLETTLRLADIWGTPQRQIPHTIHVGGTNGKGSTAHTLAAILQSAGYRVGLYTSPHLVDFAERIRVDGKPIVHQYVVQFVEDFLARPEAEALSPSFFELTTVMALRYFADMEVDVAVIEVGLGGRLDSTNIISPDMCVITNISLDHTAILGDTEAEIAAEKAGIIKDGVPVVIGQADEPAVRAVFETAAAAHGAPIYYGTDYRPDAEGENPPTYHTRYGDIRPQLTGECQRENAATILTAVELLQPLFPAISDSSVAHGFEHVCDLTGLMGRWMTVATEPCLTIADTGHNIGGWRHLSHSLHRLAASAGTLHVVIGFVGDKDASAILELLPRQARYYFTAPSVERARPAADTAALGASAGLHGTDYATVAEAVAAARHAAHPDDAIFVGGSTFIVADLLSSSGICEEN